MDPEQKTRPRHYEWCLSHVTPFSGTSVPSISSVYVFTIYDSVRSNAIVRPNISDHRPEPAGANKRFRHPGLPRPNGVSEPFSPGAVIGCGAGVAILPVHSGPQARTYFFLSGSASFCRIPVVFASPFFFSPSQTLSLFPHLHLSLPFPFPSIPCFRWCYKFSSILPARSQVLLSQVLFSSDTLFVFFSFFPSH